LIGVVAALAAEARALESVAWGCGPACWRAPLADLHAGPLLAVSGMGCAAAEQAARRLIDAGASGLVSFGLAGGLDPEIGAGDIVLPSEVISRDGARFPASQEWRERLGAAVAARMPVVTGSLLTAAQAIDSVEDKAAAFRETGAVAVDMESLAVAQVAAAHHLPFIAVRAIVDTAADALPRAVLAASESGHIRIWRLMGGLALAPAELAALFRLAQRYRAAMRSLAAIAGALAPLAAGRHAA